MKRIFVDSKDEESTIKNMNEVKYFEFKILFFLLIRFKY